MLEKRVKKKDYERGILSRTCKSWESYAMVAPFMLIFFTFTVFPVIVTILISFTNYNVLEIPKLVGWQNYINLFVDDDIFIKSIGNTLAYAFITGPFGYLIAFFASWAINETGRYTRSILTFVFYIPSISGTVYTIWSIIFDGDIYGYANSFFMKLGLIRDPIQWFTTEKYVLPLIIVVQLWMSLGVGFLAMRAGFSTVDKQYYEAGAIDGIKNRWQELWHITIPMMAPHLMTAAVLQITAMFANATVSQTLAGFPSTNYAGHLIMNHLNDYANIRLQRGYASAISVVLFLFMIGVNSLVLKTLKKVGE